MCGFLGAFHASGNKWSNPDILRFRNAFMRLSHRGNSGAGERTDFKGGALFHHRLAFRDLTEGRQPLTDSLGRATIIYNGELYGFRTLRKKLSTHFDFRTQSDTEVLLAAYLEFGPNLLSQIDGEYAFVILDHQTGKIIAARDPFGVKPIFWSSSRIQSDPPLRAFSDRYEISLGETLYFASEMKGLPVEIKWDSRGLDRLFLSL